MKTDNYIVYCKKSDFYLGDAVSNYLRQNNKSCDFWFDKIPNINNSEITKNHNFIAVINPELVNDAQAVYLIENFTLKSSCHIYLLENEKIETFPENWGEARYIDATEGLDKEIGKTLLEEAKSPVGHIVNIHKELEDFKRAEEARLEEERKQQEEAKKKAEENAKIKAEEERKIFERIYKPENLNDRIVEGFAVSSNVKKGLKYLLGDGFPKDEERAYTIFKKAIHENPEDMLASYYFALCIDFAFDKINESESTQTRQLMVEAYKKASKGGIKEADIAMASYYIETGEQEKALNIYTKLINNNHPKAKYYRGLQAEYNRQYADALDFYYEAAEDGIAEAHNALGYMYGEGWGTTKDTTKAMQWFKLAADEGLIQGKYNLALAYIISNKSDVEENALNILNELASTGHLKSIDLLKELRKEEEKERKRQQKREENEMIKQQLIDAGLNLFSHATSSFGLGSRLKR